MLDTFKQIMSVLTWPVVALIAFILLRRPIARFLDRITKFSASKDGLSFEVEKLIEKVEKVEENEKALVGTMKAGGMPSEKNFHGYKTTLKYGEIGLSDLHIIDPKTLNEESALKFSSEEENRFKRKSNEAFIRNDPQKNQWGKLSIRNNRKLSATVEEMTGTGKIFKIKFEVISTSPIDPLKGTVWFHLHPTFVNTDQEIEVINGKAELYLLSWGSFTVGVETDNKSIELELDLSDVAGVSEYFKNT